MADFQEAEVGSDARVCSACRCRVVRRRYVQCPLPTCPTSKRRVKRLRPLPNKWSELVTDIRVALESEFQVNLSYIFIHAHTYILEVFDCLTLFVSFHRSDLMSTNVVPLAVTALAANWPR